MIDCSGFVYAHPPWVADGMMITSDAEFYYTTSLSAAPPTWAAFSGGYPGTEIHDAMVEATPLKRLGEPEEIAAAAVYLASPAGAYVTGQCLAVDGGFTVSGFQLSGRP